MKNQAAAIEADVGAESRVSQHMLQPMVAK